MKLIVRLRRQAIVQLEQRYQRPGVEVLDRLRAAKLANGEISDADVARVAAELRLPAAHVNGAASFYADLGSRPRGRRHVRVCAGTSCFATTGGAHVHDLEERLGVGCGEVSADGEVSLESVYCLGYCYASPAALDGERAHAGPDLVEQLIGDAARQDPEIPFASAVDDPVLLGGLLGSGPPAWSVWPQLVRSPEGSERVRAEVFAAGLRGRGGAGFPAAQKWAAVAASADDGPRYLICNGDEGDPGSYTDRLLMERDPDRVLEGVALAAVAAGATNGFVYVRSEYPCARDKLREAVAAARAAGHLGAGVHGSGVDFDIEVFEGAGSYVAGEETSLIHSVEGLRGAVSVRPPYPTEHGLLDRPTVVNNVGTLAAVPWILARGGAAYARLGRGDSRGTELVCLNQRFRRPGAYEVEFGTTLRRLCEELGGGLRDGHRLRALQVGGPLGGFVGADQLDLPLSFVSLESAGAALGHGSLVAVDDRVGGLELLRHAWTFAARESCGTCSPCRIGCQRGHEIAEQLSTDESRQQQFERQEELLETMAAASLCSFGRSVPLMVRSIMRVYADEVAARVSQ